MPKFTLICEHRGRPDSWDDVEVRNTSEFEYEYLDDVVSAFQDFLRGCGYHFDGQLMVVNESITEDSDCCGQCNNGCSNNNRCSVCGLTREQLGNHTCFDARCPIAGGN